MFCKEHHPEYASSNSPNFHSLGRQKMLSTGITGTWDQLLLNASEGLKGKKNNGPSNDGKGMVTPHPPNSHNALAPTKEEHFFSHLKA